ncbi:MAG: M15 family metallopeptidase [Verrucomicrobiales bacterium]|nr:M15 family metallopeptidase [Verrucomicrobiales bacterium]
MRRLVFLVLFMLGSFVEAKDLPEGFVYLKEVDPTIKTDLRYASSNNFVGTRVDGYRAKKVIITEKAAEALKRIQADLKKEGYALKVFDAYRPKQAVNHFVRWARDRKNTRTKAKYYPDLPKSALVGGGYISGLSRHSSGSTVDLTLVNSAGKELDMGTPFDFFGGASAHSSQIPTPEQQANRRKLKAAMERGGFRSYYKEWWHYTLRGEPFAGQYFDFPVQ